MTDFDISTKIGPLFPLAGNPEWPMYSYERPSYMLWNAIAEGLNARGWTESQIKDWLQSKAPRWALDGDFGTDLIDLGHKFAESAEPIALPPKSRRHSRLTKR